MTSEVLAAAVRVSAGDVLIIDLVDGRCLLAPLSWFPKLRDGSQEQYENYKIIGSGIGIYWPDFDEDISVEKLWEMMLSCSTSRPFLPCFICQGGTMPGQICQRCELQVLRETIGELQKPVPMLLTCPSCSARHIDLGEFATTRIHHTHACQSCGMCWRPAIVPTVGVQFLPGFKNKQMKTEWGRIQKTPEICGGSARISGTRIPVWLVVSYQRAGLTRAKLLAQFPTLSEHDLEEAESYAEQHPDEIEADIQNNATA